MILKVFHIVASALLIALALTAGAPAETYKGNEIPTYEVIEKNGPVELRRYASQIVAEVTVAGSRSNAANRGFLILADYIFGDNIAKARDAVEAPSVSTSEKISMTAPVSQTRTDQGWVVRFMMPSEYTLETLPIPENSAIRLVEQAPESQLVLTFPGFPGSIRLTRNETILRNFAREAGVAITGAPRYYFYDGPMTFPGQRRNEIAFLVDPAP